VERAVWSRRDKGLHRTGDAQGRSFRDSEEWKEREGLGEENEVGIPGRWYRGSAILVCAAGVIVADGDATVDGLRVNGRTTGAKVGVEAVLDLSLDGDGKVDFDTAIHSAGFKMRGVVLGNAQINAAVGGFGVETLPLPSLAGERNVESAIDGLAAYIAGKPIKADAAVSSPEVQVAIETREVDAAVHGVKIGSKMTWHVQVIVDAVSGAVEEMRMRTVVANVAAVGVDDDLVEQVIGFGFRWCPSLDTSFKGNVEAVLTSDVDATIHGVEGDVAGGEGEGRAAHLADVHLAPVVSFVFAFAVVPVGRLLRGDDEMGVPVGARKRHAKNDDHGEANDKQGEAAHGADLVGCVRGWRHISSLNYDWGTLLKERARRMP
jgi:hypothetical protein